MGRVLERYVAPLVPRRKKLAFGYYIAQVIGCEPELRFLEKLGPNAGVAIDVGANVGLYTFRLAQLYEQVYAFEINPVLARGLQQVAPSNVTVRDLGLSCRNGLAVLYTPCSNGIRLDGWASMEVGNCPNADDYIDTDVKVATLDSFAITNVQFLKADVEGHEVELLQGARTTIARNRPIVLLEVRPRNRVAVCEYFSGLKYQERRLEELIGSAGTAENFIYVPR